MKNPTHPDGDALDSATAKAARHPDALQPPPPLLDFRPLMEARAAQMRAAKRARFLRRINLALPALRDAVARAEATRHAARLAYDNSASKPGNATRRAALMNATTTAKAIRRAYATARATVAGATVPALDALALRRALAKLEKAPAPIPAPRAVKKPAPRRARFRADDAPAQIRTPRRAAPKGAKPYAVRALIDLAKRAAALAAWLDTHRRLATTKGNPTRRR